MAKLYFYYSAMNAGKSTMLLQSNYNYIERGIETLLFMPAIDKRYGKGCITSRIGLSANAISVEADFDFFNFIKSHKAHCKNLGCILIDESQFLTKKQVLQLTDVVDKLNIPVLAYGIRNDFKGEPFPGSLYLLVYADDLVEIKTICHCGRKAIMNTRIDANGNAVKFGEQVQIGGNEKYISMCRKHFKEAHATILESA